MRIIIDTQGDGPTVECNNIPLGDNIVEPTVEPTPPLYYVAFTLNPYPKVAVTKNYYYSDLPPTEQKKYLYNLCKQMFYEYKNKFGFNKMIIHYELTKKGMIHAHGYVDIKESYNKYDLIIQELSGYCHKRIGLKGNYRNVSSLFKHVDDIEKWKNYCIKTNDLKPSKIISNKITDYID